MTRAGRPSPRTIGLGLLAVPAALALAGPAPADCCTTYAPEIGDLVAGPDGRSAVLSLASVSVGPTGSACGAGPC